ncbi:MAG: helix-turn-helix transcriptional regulator [Lentisphaeria bacterium]|nr:helix-turn-helix transcriptional regulator [Lentisphaeria bacterium]
MPITPLKTKFGKLIRDYLRNAEIRQNDLAARLQISGSAVSQMLHGKIVPNQQQLNAICELLQLDRAQSFELQSMLSCIRTGAENMRSPFNEAMFSLRCQRGLTHQQLANLSGIPASHLQVFENCFEAVPTLDEASKLAPILGCTPASLLQSAGVGGLSRTAIDKLTATGEMTEDEVCEAVAAYHAERQSPLLNLVDLEEFDGNSITAFAQRATKIFELGERDLPEDIVAISASGRDLAIGIPGIIQLLVTPKRPAGYRELDLCRTEDGKFVLQETRRHSVKEFRLAGTRKPNSSAPLWKLPVLEMIIRPTKPDPKEKK